MVLRVAVIGAGPVGLTSIKACLDEDIVPTCFESSDDMGGLWKFKVGHSVNKPWQQFWVSWNKTCCCQSHAVCPFCRKCQRPTGPVLTAPSPSTSLKRWCATDFPIPADYPNYMHHSKIRKYFRMYAEHFKLLQHICFQVTQSTPAKKSCLSSAVTNNYTDRWICYAF